MARQEQQEGQPRILVIDGNSVFRTSLAGFLRRHDFEVATEASGEKGLDVVEEFRPRVCVIDLLPAGRMTGVRIAEAMHEKDPSLRFIFLSAYLEPAWDERPAFLEAAPLLRKPIDLQELTAVVSLALSTKTRAPAHHVPPSPRGGPGSSLPLSDRGRRSSVRDGFETPFALGRTIDRGFRH